MSTLRIYKIVHDGVPMNLDVAGLFSEIGLHYYFWTEPECVISLFLQRGKKIKPEKI